MRGFAALCAECADEIPLPDTPSSKEGCTAWHQVQRMSASAAGPDGMVWPCPAAITLHPPKPAWLQQPGLPCQCSLPTRAAVMYGDASPCPAVNQLLGLSSASCRSSVMRSQELPPSTQVAAGVCRHQVVERVALRRMLQRIQQNPKSRPAARSCRLAVHRSWCPSPEPRHSGSSMRRLPLRQIRLLQRGPPVMPAPAHPRCSCMCHTVSCCRGAHL